MLVEVVFAGDPTSLACDNIFFVYKSDLLTKLLYNARYIEMCVNAPLPRPIYVTEPQEVFTVYSSVHMKMSWVLVMQEASQVC